MSLQFKALYRLSLSRVIDLEIISSHGDLYGLLARTGGALLALSLTLLMVIVVPYVRHAGMLQTTRVWNDEEFLISITLAVAGIASVLAWNNVLPDRQDSLVLGTLPVRVRTIAMARLAAIATCLGVLILLVNGITGSTFPYLLAGRSGALRSLAAWWITMAAAGLFAFTWTLALQGVAAQVFRRPTFLRVSAAMQLASLFVVLGLFFLTPPIAATLSTHAGVVEWLPSYWFTGLLHWLRGDRNAALERAALLGLRNLAITTGLAMVCFALSWFRQMRTIVESADIASGSGQSIFARGGNLLVRAFCRRPLDRAMLLFVARTASRSRQHRLLLAAYAGIGVALAVTFSRSFFVGASRGSLRQPGVPLLVTGILMTVCAVRAMRAIFVLPHTLPANWILRVTAVRRPADYFSAVRRALLIVAVLPAWVVCSAGYWSVWPAPYALEASLVLGLVGLILTDWSLSQFRKFPFACSWMPSSVQSLDTVRALAYGLGFLISASALGALELAALRDGVRFAILCSVLAAGALWLYRRNREFASSPANAVQFDDRPTAEIFALDLHPDGEWSTEQAWVQA